ncbi:Cell division inhibitor [[Actinomadura] parvosata subsp. kistnae]|uniref:TIGR01777 family protein n=1 Tax=[Actinomadura] parvosata subsp. kistnae TaxID=1909395 RepID=A0A1V0A497_9ACTN|nr:TIGR01777 family oxidoreductase [Nonomuraea sp. ATCC 55076]AQZ64972.1 TIGR01777 family protein [Nonomuraea sp. ATCC 55076]SPL96211.1 Cell division inhibitor [Actinomadura parvosata subsp. kistnae]
MAIIVTGASGLLGTALVAALRAGGREVVRLVRRPPQGDGEAFWDPAEQVVDLAALDGSEAVVHLAGASIAGRRWTPAYRRELVESRTRGTRVLVDALRELSRPPEVLLSASGMDFYGDTGDRLIDEGQGKGRGFLADLCEAWEAEARRAGEAGIRTVQARTSLVLSRDGGALGRILPIFRMGLGAPLGTGRQYWSWISVDDWVGAALHVLRTPGIEGPVNFSAPQPVTNAEFTRTLGKALRRGTVPIPVPAFALAAGLGAFAREGLLVSHRLEPAKLTAGGYRFAHTRLDEALRAVL